MVLNPCGRFCLSARRQEIGGFDTGNFEFKLVGELIPSFSCISSSHIQDTRTPSIVVLVRKVLL